MGEADRLESVAADARRGLEDAAAYLKGARDSAREAATAAGALNELRGRLDPLAEATNLARGHATGCDEVRTQAEAALAAAQRTDAAAAAAHGLDAGDDCPICARKLPKGFKAPESADLDAAQQVLTSARSTAAQADLDARRLEAEQEQLITTIGGAERAAAKAAELSGAALEGVVKVVGPVDLSSDDATLLAGVTATAASATDAANVARAAAGLATTERAEAEGLATAEAAKVASAIAELRTARERLDTISSNVDSELASLPPLASPTVPLSQASIGVAVERLGVAAETAERLEADTALAVAAHQDAVETHAAAERERHLQVGIVVPEVRAALRAAATSLSAAAAAADTAIASPPPGPDGSVADLAEWASTLPASAQAAVDACRLRAETAVAAAGVARAARDEALAAVGSADADGLNQEIGAVRTNRDRTVAELEEAERQIPLAAALDEATGQAQPLLDALTEVADLLKPAQFPKWVIEQRQRKLLELAADRLGEMTGNRLRFAEGFQIHDQLTDMSRDPGTLSGGEMFMASLALALTLVEMSTGSGDPQGALFLDEGFSSLDGDCLTDAMQVLDTQTAGGRVVAIITHLRSVAEYVDQVLWAEKGPGTSTLRPLSAEEVEKLLANDAASGLLV